MQHSLVQPVVVGAAILDDVQDPSHLLAARRKAPKSLAGYWEFPGGKVEENESYTSGLRREVTDRKSTRLNSSHVAISYAVFCLKKKIKNSSTTHLSTNTQQH